MKFYNVKEGELHALTALDAVASLLLSFAMACMAFYFGANWDLLLASGLDERVLAEARAARTVAGWAAFGCGALTVLVVVARFSVIHRIQKTSRVIEVR